MGQNLCEYGSRSFELLPGVHCNFEDLKGHQGKSGAWGLPLSSHKAKKEEKGELQNKTIHVFMTDDLSKCYFMPGCL